MGRDLGRRQIFRSERLVNTGPHKKKGPQSIKTARLPLLGQGYNDFILLDLLFYENWFTIAESNGTGNTLKKQAYFLWIEKNVC